MATRIDVSQVIENQRPGWFVIRLVLLSALVTFVDGYDLNVIAYAAPYLAPAFHLDKIMLGTVFSVGNAGTLVGGFTFGFAGDRLGRRTALVFATAAFGVLTLALTTAQTYEQFLLLRFINGIALGGAIPLVWAHITEFVPKRYRATSVTLTMLGYGLGVSVSGPTSVALIPNFGWVAVFAAGGAMALAVALLLYLTLPESLRFLTMRRREPWKVAKTVRAIAPDRIVPADAQFMLCDESPPDSRSHWTEALFQGELRKITPLLWIAYIASSMSAFFLTSWGPLVYEGLGYARNSAAWLMSMNSIAGAIGAVTLMRFTDRVGVISLAVFPATAVPLLVVVGTAHLGQTQFASLIPLLCVFLSGSHYGIASVAGTFYPTTNRATGTGWASSMAKLGSIAGPWIGGYVLSSNLPVQRAFALMAVCPAILCVCVCAISLAQRDALRRGAGSFALSS